LLLDMDSASQLLVNRVSSQPSVGI
jgi:hypothetical protein